MRNIKFPYEDIVVNTRNLHKIHAWDKNSKVMELKSGARVVLSSGYFDKFRDIYRMSVSRCEPEKP